MQHVEVERTFPAPPEAVWEIYADHAGWHEWAGLGASRLEREGETERNGTGCVRVLGAAPMAAYEEILEFEPPRRMTYRVVRGGLPMRDHLGEVLLEDQGGRTRLVWRCRFESRWPGFGPVFRVLVTQVFSRALAGLARRHFPG